MFVGIQIFDKAQIQLSVGNFQICDKLTPQNLDEIVAFCGHHFETPKAILLDEH
jgi:hypothetical protein